MELNTINNTCDPTPIFFLISMSILSLLGCLYVLLSYLYVAGLRQHPADIMFGMSIYGLCYHVLFLLKILFKSISCGDIAPILDFFLAGQELYLLMFALDLFLALKNPFSADKERMIKYHLIAASTSFVFGMIAYKDYANALFGFCWMNYNSKSILLNNHKPRSNGLFFAIEVILVYLFSLIAMVKSWTTLRKGLPDTFLTRKRILRHLKYYVGIYFLYWTMIFLMYGIYSFSLHTNQSRCKIFNILSMALLSKGMVNAIIWTRTSNVYQVIEQLKTFGYVDLPLDNDSINWALRLEFLTNTTKGISQSVEKTENDPFNNDLHVLTSSEKKELFLQVQEINLSYNDIKNKNNNNKDNVIFIDYAPKIFRYLRKKANINYHDYLNSLKETTKERVSEGKSGAFFIFTQDKKYVVKTLKCEEIKFLLTILPNYCHFIINNPNTLITRFFGCHAITMYNKTVYFVVMESIFSTDLKIHERFDLKGSWVGRLEGRKRTGTRATCKYCSKEYLIAGIHDQLCDARDGNLRHSYDQVGKDLNWNKHMSLSNEMSEKVAKQLIKDSQFLQSIHSIDYSLLIGIHYQSFNIDYTDYNKSNNNIIPFHKTMNGGMTVQVVRGPGIYFMGIIDILQVWNFRKKLEYFIRVYILFQDRYGVSVVNPIYYAERFRQRVVKEIIINYNNHIHFNNTNITYSSANTTLDMKEYYVKEAQDLNIMSKSSVHNLSLYPNDSIHNHIQSCHPSMNHSFHHATSIIGSSLDDEIKMKQAEMDHYHRVNTPKFSNSIEIASLPA